MIMAHSARCWRWKSCACDGAPQVVIRVAVATWKMRTGEPEDGLDLRSGFALREQKPGDPQIHDAPVRLRKAFENMPSLHTAPVDCDGLRGAAWARICGGPVDRERRGRRRLYRLPDRLQQRLAARRQTHTGVDESHPRGVAGWCASRGFLIGESREPSQVTPVGAGPIAPVEVCQVSAGGSRHGRLQRRGAEANPSLQMAGAGLQGHTRIMPLGAHVRNNARPRDVQIDENVTCVLLSTVGLNINIATFPVARAQKPNRGCVRQLLGGPEPFARKSPMSLVVNQTDEVQLVWHCRELPANTLESDPESAVVHNRNSVAAIKRRTMDFRQTARCVLTGCLSPGGRSTSTRESFMGAPSQALLKYITGQFISGAVHGQRCKFLKCFDVGVRRFFSFDDRN